jgi:hypothetical protein
VGLSITDEIRNRTSLQAPAGNGITPLWPSLQATLNGVYLIVDDGEGSKLILLRQNQGSTTIQVERFESSDYARIRDFAERVDPALKPRPQGSASAIATGNRHPEISLPAAFDAFSRIQADFGVNLASTVQLSATREMTLPHVIGSRNGEDPVAPGHTRVDIRHLFHCGLWASARAGFRMGYNAEADHFIVNGNDDDEIAASMEAAKEAIRMAAGYTKFTTDTSRVFELRADPRHPQAWTQSRIDSIFDELFEDEERSWILSEFTRTFDTGVAEYELGGAEVRRLAVKFGRSLLMNEELFDEIRRSKGGRPFDFEPSLDEAETLTTPEELIFYMHWLQSRGRAAQLAPPNLGFKKRQAYPETMEALKAYAGKKMWPEVVPAASKTTPLDELGSRIRELAAVARLYDGTLSIHSGSGKQPEVLRLIGRETGGRFNYKISGELQLQLFDVLREQPEGSEWRALYERMVARCEGFAASGAFGEESKLAVPQRELRGDSLGDAQQGRVDGNLFLVFWLGNINGSRDVNDPSGDRRFFKEKIDEMPAGLLGEVRKRNSDYVYWLAKQLLNR